QVVEGADTAARDDRQVDRVEQFAVGTVIGTFERAVAPDVGRDDRGDARPRESRGQRDEVEPGFGRPAVDGDVAPAGVEADGDLSRVQRGELIDDFRIFDRRAAHDDSVHARGQALRRVGDRAYTAARLDLRGDVGTDRL